MTTLVADLATDDVFSYAGTTVTVLSPPEPSSEPFGRDGFVRLYCRRSDTGAEGWMLFGPDAQVTRALCPKCGRELRHWPLRRPPLCSPKDWVHCIRPVDAP